MRGQNIILQRRFDGETPTLHVSVLPHEPAMRGFLDVETYSDNDEIEIGPNENLGTLDLRCVHGCLVLAAGLDDRTTMTLCQRLMVFTPLEIVACMQGDVWRWRPGMADIAPIETQEMENA